MKYLILGAGVAGLTFANRLLAHGINNFIILEKEDTPGGLCRSKIVDNSPLDIGGGHFLDVRRPHVNDFLFQFMPRTEWNIFERDSRIEFNNVEIGHPFEANIWQLPIEEQIEYLISIAQSGSTRNAEKPSKFVEWITWKLGNKIAENYMLPYNKKMFGDDLNLLGTYWLEKLPSVSFKETLKSCLLKKSFGTQPGHAQFLYPKNYGYGELWTRLAEQLGNKIQYNVDVKGLNFETKTVIFNNTEKIQADKIITTIPWTELSELENCPTHIKTNIKKLVFKGTEVEYIPKNLNTNAHWIYCPDYDVPYHRILVRHNFCTNSRGYWTETNNNGTKKKIGKFYNKYAYPLNTVEKPNIITPLLQWAKSKDVYGLGRWGEWEHFNSDLTVEKAIHLADTLTQ